MPGARVRGPGPGPQAGGTGRDPGTHHCPVLCFGPGARGLGQGGHAEARHALVETGGHAEARQEVNKIRRKRDKALDKVEARIEVAKKTKKTLLKQTRTYPFL